MTTILYVLIAILLLGLLVTAHEFGHFISARLCGIAVNEFSIGFGPRLCGWESKKTGTKFSLRALPLGGFCAFFGEDDAEGKHVDDPRAYARQPVWKRMISVLMGPGMNFILAFVVLLVFLFATGIPVYDPYIRDVEAGGPAMQAGVQPGDVVVAIDGTLVRDGRLDSVSAAIAGHTSGDALTMTLLRGGEEVTAAVTPFYDEEAGRYRAGVILSLTPRMAMEQSGAWTAVNERLSLAQAASLSWDNCVYAGTMIVGALKDLLLRGEGLDQTSGPVGVVSMVSEQVRTGGFETFIDLLVVISINLGVMNLLPIPGLDGSRFLFMVLEAIRRKPIAPQREALVHLAGMVLLFGLMIFLTFKDVLDLFR